MLNQKKGFDVKGYAAIGGEPPDIDSPKSAERHWEWQVYQLLIPIIFVFYIAPTLLVLNS